MIFGNKELKVRQFEITNFGGAETLKEFYRAMPQVSGDQVRVRVRFAGLNYADVMQRRGLYPGIQEQGLPYTPGMEVVGEIDAIGPDVSNLSVGQRVFAKLEMGGYSEFVVAPAQYVFVVPEGIVDEDVLGLVGTSGQTAFGVAKSLKAARGRFAFITAAAGGVGTVLIQICKHLGWVVIAGVSSDEKAAYVSAVGADYAIRYDRDGWEAELLEISGEAGLAIVLDSVGGEPNREALDALGAQGELVFFGAASGDHVGLPPEFVFPFIGRCNSVRGFGLIGYYLSGPNVLAETIEGLFDLYLSGVIQNVFSSIVPAGQVVEVHRAMENRETRGKIQLDMQA
ncbi:MAG: zinc-binding dehydrogenase [Pseudomonadota bacterium]